MVKYQQERAIKWLMSNQDLWVGKPITGEWNEKGWTTNRPPISDARRIIVYGLKLSGIYSKSIGLRDMRVNDLVAEARRRING